MGQSSVLDNISARAQEIYDEKFREQYESEHRGKFVAIDIKDGNAYMGDFAEDALIRGREEAPHGVFHLIRIGYPGAFRTSHVGGAVRQNRYW